jgi:ATP-dependent DNA helicase RecQ
VDEKTTSSELRAEAEQLLRTLAGPDARLRDDQWAAIEVLVLGGQRALVVQRTGWGKSAIYFIATALLRARGAGATVIVSPLLALMRNQIEAGARAGIRAHTINSSNPEEWTEVEAAIAAREIDVLLVSPERLNNPAFVESVLPQLTKETGLLVIDEAHCISDWGHDFRPDYRRLKSLLAGLPPGIPVLATTATANARVVADVSEQLEVAGGSSPTLVLRGSLDRESLHLGVLELPSDAHRLAWLAEQLDALPGSGIIYTLTIAQAEAVSDHLRRAGHAVSSYTGKTETAERLQAESDLLANRVKALVATSALGMGFDKPDLGFVIHFGAPSSPVAYYQQVGRAGRGVDRATVLLLPGSSDEDIWEYFATSGFPDEPTVSSALSVLAAADRPVSVPVLETTIDLGRSRLESMLKVLDVEGAVRRTTGGWVATGRPWQYDTERYAKVAAVRAAEQQAMRDYIAMTGCRMEFLRRQLDDPEAAPCGRCDRCADTNWTSSVSESAVAESREQLAQPGVSVEPRKQWPTGLSRLGIDLTGKIAAEEAVTTGRVIARLSDIGWGAQLRRLLHETSPDGAVPADLVGAIIKVLKGWGWEQRPVAVASVPSTRRPLLIASLAEQIATRGRLEDLGALDSTRFNHSPASQSNSAQRVRALDGAFQPSARQRAAIPGLGGAPLLLVDDLIGTGWTMAVAGRELRLAGVAQVLPFALALRG